MCMHTWEGPESYQTQTQNQANHTDWPRETWKKCPHKSDSNLHKGTTFSLSPSVCLATRTLFLPNKHFTCFTTFPLHAKIHFYITDMPRSCHWPLLPGGLEARIQHSRCNGLTLHLWQGTKILLQAAAGWSHHRSLCSILLICLCSWQDQKLFFILVFPMALCSLLSICS